MKSVSKVEGAGKGAAEAKPQPTQSAPLPSHKAPAKKGMGAGTKVVLTTVIGVPVIMLAGMKLEFKLIFML